MKQRWVLYVARKATGGSAFSLYYLANGLDASRYAPVVLFYTQEHPYIGQKLAQSGIRTITLSKNGSRPLRQAQGRPSPVEAGRQPVTAQRRDIGGWLRAHVGEGASQAYAFLKDFYQFTRWHVPKIWPIVRAIREAEADLVHVNTTPGSGKAAIIAARLAGKPCVCHIRVFHELTAFDRLFVRLVDQFIYISRAVADTYVSQGVPRTKGTVVHNAVDLSEFEPCMNVGQVRREFGWTGEERLVGVIGRLDWWKGHEYFLEAMARVSQEIPDLRALIVGKPEASPRNQSYFQMLQSLTKSLGLENRVVFTGFRTDVPRIVQALDVVVLSSSAPEPFGRVVIEGMAAGKAVVATGAGGVLDIIEDGVSGVLVPCKDSVAMADAVLALLSDREKARQMGIAARQRVEEKFTVQRHAATVQGLYDAILGN
jgi:glycosyltransferase involved in cell wall biosynthesis